MFNEQEERDEDLDTEDADLEDENSDDEDTEDKDAEDEEDEESDDDEDDADKKDKDSEEDDDKPVTKGELKKLLKGNQNKSNAQRRVDSKKGRNNKPSPKLESRLDTIEQTQKRSELLERKRQFGYENSLSPKEVDVVFKLTKRPTAKFLKEPYVAGAIAAIRQQSNVRANTPGSGGQPFKSAGGKEWKDLKPEEKQANFADRRRSILDAKRNR